jgi:galactokinase
METAYAPGRVELLGNHTDYNEGYVLSAAIDRGVTITGAASGSTRVSLHSATLGNTHEADAASLSPDSENEWANYPLGVLDVFAKAGLPVSGFTAEIASNLPLGAGLSSSAALEVATGTLLKKIFGFELDRLQLAKLCRRAENEFVGVNCGLLDQASSAFGKAEHIIFLDCRLETVETTPIPAGIGLLITQCGVPHRLAGGEYNERREQCFDAAARLGAKALRDVSSAQLQAGKASLPELSYRRAAHIVGENERVLRGLEFLRAHDAGGFGALMFASHESSRVNFENSTPELDTLVEIARELPGVLGSRLTGGGFGGATVTLVELDKAAEIEASLIAKYRKLTGFDGKSHLCKIADGAH